MSSNEPDRATRSLPVFAERGSWCRDGWGVGFFQANRAIVKKSRDAVKSSENAHPAFLETVQKSRSNTIVAHVRYATSDQVDDCDAHPFVIEQSDRDWIFAHNGSIPNLVERGYPSSVEPHSDIDSARAFTYIMNEVEMYIEGPGIKGLYPAIKTAVAELRSEMGGTMNFLLSDGNNLFVFNDGSHGNDVYYLQRRKPYGHAFLVTTISPGLSDEQWNILPKDRLLVLDRGEVLVFSDRL